MANKIYYVLESTISFKSSGGQATFTPASVTDAAGRISAQYDRGSASKAALFKWRAKTKAGAALALGARLEIYLATSDGTIVDGNQSTSDAAFSSAGKKNNLQFVGAIIADSTSNGEPQIGSGYVEIRDRYISVVWWNALGQSLTGTNSDHEFILEPVPDEVQ